MIFGKQFGAAALLLAIISFSCSREDAVPSPEAARARIRVALSCATRSDVAYDENSGGIRYLDICIFRPDGSLDARKRIGDTDPSDGLDGWISPSRSFEIACTAGERRVYVFANCDAFPEDAANLEESALGKEVTLDEVEVYKAVPMSGAARTVVRGDISLNVTLVRWSSKVLVDQVLLSEDSTLDPSAVRLDAVYIMNARNSAVPSWTGALQVPVEYGTSTLNSWSETSGGVPSLSGNGAVTSYVDPGTLSRTSGLGPWHFYPFPNDSPWNTGSETIHLPTAREKAGVSCLVFRFLDSSDGSYSYQHVVLPALKPNYLYEFSSILIRTKGGADEWTGAISGSVSYTWPQWESGGSMVFDNGEGMTVNVTIKPEWIPGASQELSNSGHQGGAVIPSAAVDGGSSAPVF